MLSLPGALVAEVQHDGGAEVHFDASAVDLVDGSPQVTCEPSSGSTFPVGETEVLCDAIDGSGNRSDGGFFVTVYRPFSDRCEVHPECASPKFSVGQHSLLVRGDGAVFASGRRAFGALGDGVSDGSCRNTPMPVPGLDAVKAVAVGANHSLAVRNDGTVWAWGRAALGTGDDALPVTQVPVLHDVVDVAVGDTHALALARDSTVWGWGRNHRLQLGATLPDTGVEQPVQLEGLAGVRQVVAMGDSSWVVKDDGTVWGLGENNGLLGGSVGSPVKAVGVSGVARVRTGPLSVFAIRHDGAVWVWGRPRNVSQGGVPGQNATPHLVWGLDGVVDLASATTHTLVLKADGTVWGWGQNEWGQLGTSVSPEGTSTLAQVEGVTNAVGVFAWGPLSMALLRDGSMRWWGLSVCGNHGTNGGFLNSYMPQVSHFTFDTGCGEAPGCFDNVCGFRGCSARGVCGSGGSCACEPGFFGALCEEQDSEPPVLTVPSQVQVPATSAAGEPVSWEASAEDALDGPVPVTCEPPSGSLFAPGVSTVTCSAMDSAGNVATASFEVLVEPLDAGVPGTDAGVESPGEPRGCGCGLAGAQWLTVCALWLLRRRPQQALAPSQSEES